MTARDAVALVLPDTRTPTVLPSLTVSRGRRVAATALVVRTPTRLTSSHSTPVGTTRLKSAPTAGWATAIMRRVRRQGASPL